MHISILLMEQIIELFIMILMGFIIVKAGIVKDEDSKVLSKIVLYLIIPCVIIMGVEVEAIQQLRQLRVGRHGGVPLGPGGAQTAARGAGVIDLVALLGGMLGVHPQAHALARRLCGRAEL